MSDLVINFTSELWKYKGKAAWYFITLPEEEAAQIRMLTSHNRRGWGSVRVAAIIGGVEWKTSIFPDSKANSWLLPVKADVRKQAGLKEGDRPEVRLTITLA